MRAIRKILGGIALAAFTVVAAPTTAHAHTNFVSSDPADGSALVSPPSVITLSFSEAPSTKFLVVDLKNAAGVAVAPTKIDEVNGRVVITLPKLADDTYRLKYRVRDPIDLHLTTGSIVFGVGQSPTLTSQAAETGSPNLSDAIAKFIERLALIGLIGSIFVAFGLRIEPARALRLAVVCGLGLAVAEVAAILNETIDVGGGVSTLGRVMFSSSFGRRSIVAMQLGIGAGLLARIVRRINVLDRRDVLVRVLFALACACVFAVGYSGHASVGGSPIVGVALRFLHLTALAIWLGGIVTLLAIRAKGPAWVYFGRWAFGCVVVVTASGFALSSREVASATALGRTTFGRSLLVKLVVIAGVMVAAVLNHRKVRRKGAVGLASARFESAALVIAVALGALLASTPPAVGVQFEKPAKTVPAVQTLQTDDLIVTVSVSPNRPGKNIVSTSVVTTRRPSPGKISSIKLSVEPLGQTPTQLQQIDTTSLTPVDVGTVQLPSAGALTIGVDIARPARVVKPVRFDWTVNPTPIARPAAFVSDSPLAGFAWLLAALVVVVGAITALVWRRRLLLGNAVGS